MGLFVGFLLGLVFGLLIIIIFVICENKRSISRSRLAVSTAAFSQLNVDDVRKLFSKQSLPQWILFTEYDKVILSRFHFVSGLDSYKQVSWLNNELRKMWPYVDKATSELTRAIVEPILEQYRPPVISSLKFQKFTLGTVAPQFVGIQKVETTDDEIVLEIELQWDGNPSIILGVKTMLGVSLPPIQVKDIAVTGVFRVVFKPLVDTFPCFGAVMYSLREQKKLDFKLKVIAGDMKTFPMFAGAIDGMIRTAITDSYLWPMRQVIPILPGDYRDLELRVCGKLKVKLVQAKDLLNMDFIGKSDPFAQLFIRPIPSKMKKSSTIDNDLNPIWNEVFEFEVEDPSTQKLTIHVFDEDNVQASELLGSTQVPLRDLEPGAVTEFWLPLLENVDNNKEAKYRGQVQLELLYIPLDQEAEKKTVKLSTLVRRSSLTNGSYLSQKKSFFRPCAVHYKVSDENMIAGRLLVLVRRGEKLSAKDLNGKSDPYAVLYMKKSRSDCRKTRVMYKTLNPVWDQSYSFDVGDAAYDLLVIEVWDKDVFRKDFIGKCALTLSRVLNEGSYECGVELAPKASGKVHIRLKWDYKQHS